jgi:hypothetical protein
MNGVALLRHLKQKETISEFLGCLSHFLDSFFFFSIEFR